MSIFQPARLATALLFLCFSSFAYLGAQTVDVSLVMVPSDPDIGDTVLFEVHASTSSSIGGFDADFYFDPAVYDLGNYTATAVSSWLGSPGELDLTSSLSADTLHFSLERFDHRTYQGTGKVAELDGIVILDDIHTKRESAGLLGAKASAGPALQIYPNPTKGIARLVCKGTPRKITLASTAGRIWELPAEMKLDLRELPEGLYYVRVEMEDGSAAYQRLLLKR